MKIKDKISLPSPLRVLRDNKKVIFIGLAILIVPMFLGFMDSAPTNAITHITLTEQQKQDFLDKVVNTKIQEIEKQFGYVNVQARYIPPLVNAEYNSLYNINYNQTIEERIIENYIFTTEYYTLTKDNIVYYFKTQDFANQFLTEITKYGNINYTENIKRDSLNKETSQEVLDKAIAEKKAAYEKALAEKRAREEAARKAAAAAAAKKSASTTTYSYTPTGVKGQDVVNYALQFNGNPYVHGGTSLTNGADCSGFTQSVYKHFGVNLPRNAASQATFGKAVSFNDKQPGDLILYSTNGGQSVTHVAIYIGNGKIIHARTPAKGIGVTPVTGGMVVMGVRRVI
jgi:cell wall-associated NlpC family hydrolase